MTKESREILAEGRKILPNNTMNESNVGGPTSPNFKEWKDLTADEKIERLKDVCTEMQRRIQNITETLYGLKDDFGKHTHDGDKIKVPWKEYRSSGLGIGGLRSPLD
jgi:hypothetical protein